MHVNNETGVIQPVDEIKDAIKDIAPNAAFLITMATHGMRAR